MNRNNPCASACALASKFDEFSRFIQNIRSIFQIIQKSSIPLKSIYIPEKPHKTQKRHRFSSMPFGGERGIWTLATLSRPTPLAGEPLHHLGISPYSVDLRLKKVAERVGFEPTDARASPVFKTGAFNRSAISPQCACTLYHTFGDLSTDTLKYAPTLSEYKIFKKEGTFLSKPGLSCARHKTPITISLFSLFVKWKGAPALLPERLSYLL